MKLTFIADWVNASPFTGIDDGIKRLEIGGYLATVAQPKPGVYEYFVLRGGFDIVGSGVRSEAAAARKAAENLIALNVQAIEAQAVKAQ